MPAAQPGARGTRRIAKRLAPRSGEAGLTLIELIVAFSLMLILSLMALPVARVKVQREKEERLREALHAMRQAIDRHKDMADKGELGELDPDNYGYPESLDALVSGVETGSRADGPGQGLGLEPSRGIGTGTGRQTAAGGAFGAGSASPFGSNNAQGSFGSGSRGGFGSGSGSSAFGTRAGGMSSRMRTGLDRDDDAPGSVRFLRSIPEDPMTGQKEWGLLGVSDDPASRSWGGRNVFDVYSLSNSIALDGTRYSEW